MIDKENATSKNIAYSPYQLSHILVTIPLSLLNLPTFSVFITTNSLNTSQ